jgi:hypothetical protein
MTAPAVPGADRQRQPYRRLLALATAMTTRRTLTDLLQDLAGQLQGVLDCQSLGIMLYDGARYVMRWHLLETSAPTRWPIPQEVPLEGSMAGGEVWSCRPVCMEKRFCSVYELCYPGMLTSFRYCLNLLSKSPTTLTYDFRSGHYQWPREISR